MNQKAIIEAPAPAASLPMRADEVIAQVQTIQSIMEAVMKKDVHYGVIPGTERPTLFKPGAEKLLSTFRIAVDPEIEDLSTDDAIRYRIRARGIHQTTGLLIGTGIGEASSNEEKYKWKRAFDDQYADAAEDHRRIKKKGQYSNKQIRTDPADVANTILKMAKKRAMVDLCLTALAASDVFEQDLEDMPAPDRSQPDHAKAGTEAPQRKTSSGGMATDNQIRIIRAKCEDAGLVEIDLALKFGADELAFLPADKVNDVLDYLRTAASSGE